MNYPAGLSQQQMNRVERARDLAEIELRRKLKDQPNPHRLNLARDFVFAVFRELATQVAEAEADGGFGGSSGRQWLEHFLQFELCPHAYELGKLSGYTIGFYDFPLVQFRARILEQVHDSDTWTEYLQNRLSAWNRVPGRSVTAALVKRRRALVAARRQEQGMSVADFSRHAGMSDSAIRGVVKEDRSRFNAQSQKKLLKLLAVDIEEWYRL